MHHFRVHHEVVRVDVVGGLGQAQHDAVVSPHGLYVQVVLFQEPALDGHGPRGVDGRSERRMDAHAPVTDLVAEAFHHDGAVIRHHTGGLCLLVQVRNQVRCCKVVQHVLGLKGCYGVVLRHGARLAHERTQSATEFHRPAHHVAVPERHLARLAGCRRDDDALERDVLDAPGAGTQQEGLARSGLVHHLLVELAHACSVGQEHAEQAAVGNGAAVGDRQSLCTVARPDGARDAVPHDARTQFAELLAGVTPREQVEHVVQHVVAEFGESRRAPDHHGQFLHRQVTRHGGVRHYLLRENIERIAQVRRGLDAPVEHGARDHRGLEQVMTVLRIDGAVAGLTHCVAGTADALQTTADRSR